MNDVDWLKCETREKYLELMEKWASGDLRKKGKKISLWALIRCSHILFLLFDFQSVLPNL
jgi:hypothetical protein